MRLSEFAGGYTEEFADSLVQGFEQDLPDHCVLPEASDPRYTTYVATSFEKKRALEERKEFNMIRNMLEKNPDYERLKRRRMEKMASTKRDLAESDIDGFRDKKARFA